MRVRFSPGTISRDQTRMRFFPNESVVRIPTCGRRLTSLNGTIRIGERYDPVCPPRHSATLRVSNAKTRIMRSAALAKVFALTIICVSHSNSCGGTETQSEDKIITAIYRQVLRRDPKPEDLKHYSYALRYEKTVKETVKEICGTREFMQAITKRSTKQGIITCYERILARTPTDDELHRSSELLANSDWNLVISGLIESSEYKLWFGDLTVPYPRDRESQLLTYKPPEHREHRVGHAPGSGGSSGFSYHPSPSASPTKDGKPKVSATPASTPFPRATQESARLSIAPPPDEPDWDGRAAK